MSCLESGLQPWRISLQGIAPAADGYSEGFRHLLVPDGEKQKLFSDGQGRFIC